MPLERAVATLLPSRSAMRIKSIAFALLLAGVAACNTLTHGSGTTPQNPSTIPQGANHGFEDTERYGVRLGPRVRLGLATGIHKTPFTIPSSLVSGLTPIRF